MTPYFSVPPIGLSSPQVECLSSYVRRLSLAHGVTQHQFISHLQSRWKSETGNHLPRCDELRWDGYSPNVAVAVSAFKFALGFDLTGTTLLPLRQICSPTCIGSIKHERVWCPGCLSDDRGSHRPPYDRLLWRIHGIDRCALHKLQLRRVCPHCGACQLKRLSKTELDRCCICSQSLCSRISVGEYAAHPGFGELQTEQLITRLREVEGVSGGSLTQFLASIDTPQVDLQRELGDLFHTRHRPPRPHLTSLVAVAAHFNVDIIQLIVDPISAAAQASLDVGGAIPQRRRRQTTHLRGERSRWFKRELEEAIAAGPPYPSTAEFCRSRDYSVCAASTTYPLLTAELSRKHFEWWNDRAERRKRAAIRIIAALMRRGGTNLPIKALTQLVVERSGAPVHVVRRLLGTQLPSSISIGDSTVSP